MGEEEDRCGRRRIGGGRGRSRRGGGGKEDVGG